MIHSKEFIPSHEVRGYRVVYREKEVNRCPGCGHSHWYVGRVSAECGVCSTALPLESARASRDTYRQVDRSVWQLDAA